ncbi:hypothetical protein, partial [Pseudomonas aeruginosa]|uniref:hypothetical protein n=1 Tax=Pseudomonas aeruginosa TaxID=287 RepID=UPI001BD47658
INITKMVKVLTILTRLTRIQKGRDFPCKISRLKAVFERLWGDEKSSPALLWFLTGATGSRISPGDTPDCPSACHRRCR